MGGSATALPNSAALNVDQRRSPNLHCYVRCPADRSVLEADDARSSARHGARRRWLRDPSRSRLS